METKFMSEFFRKRLIPSECIHLKDDLVLYQDDEYIITRWKTFRPKDGFVGGLSLYCIKQGYKISRFFKEDGTTAYIYCDIIDTEYTRETDTYVFTDLLADVIVYNDGTVKVVDIDELADALEQGTLSVPMLSLALRRLDSLLSIIYDDRLREYTNVMDAFL
jgi:predicted RNA-binding protein associated with RNAse of E/G family